MFRLVFTRARERAYTREPAYMRGRAYTRGRARVYECGRLIRQ